MPHRAQQSLANTAAQGARHGTCGEIASMELRPLGKTDLRVSPVALGCWPIAGMTSINVNDDDSLTTIASCLDSGINFLDTAFNYGPNGESERLIQRALGPDRERMVIATKGGLHWGPNGQPVHDARPETLKRECDESFTFEHGSC